MSIPKNILLYIFLFVGINTLIGQTELPNVVYINVDDLGYKDVGFMGSTYYDTPNLNTLATEGMVFTNGYAAAANCAPSRACFMTGQNTPRHGVYTVSPSARGHKKSRKLIPTKNIIHITSEIQTLAEIFKSKGYTTGTFGKWHVSNNPLRDGFDVNFGGNYKGNPGKNGYTAPYNQLPNLDIAPEGENLTDRLTSETIKFITQNKDKPFFAYIPFYTVHTPLMGKTKLVNKYKNKQGSNGQNNPVFAAMVENMDTNVGKILATLKDLGLEKNTLVVFTSDNGGIRAISNQTPLRAGKGSYYEGGTRVPLIVKYPKIIQSGLTNNTPVINLDFFPTFMEVLNINSINQDLDGVSILPLLKGKTINERPLFWHFPIYLQAYNQKEDDGRDPLFRTRPGSTVLYKNWKLHHYFEDGDLELYNLTTDLGERNDLSKVNPTKTKELYTMLKSWRIELAAEIPEELNPEFDSNYKPKKK
ncbi:sulfatase [Urechidicola vernalis]|uniref:Sulfatase n=1 Tax=Urechidicola vernalis TaxID=3075600 RepID=A0ABU2Y4H3_9FLAO|nr:sulfatase [Urechidicola sp. P050]MDT0552690.1 sulfatase [Urechidicola sp. P050]